MDQNYDISPLNSSQIPYPAMNVADNKTDVSPPQQRSLICLPAGSSLFSPEPQSMMYQRSSLFPLSTPLSSSSLFYDSPSAPVENRKFSIGFNNNHSQPPMIHSTRLENNPSLPPMIPSTRSNHVRISGKTLPPRKEHKRSKSDIIGLNSMIPLNFPELNDPKPLEPIIGESSKGKEGVGEMKYDEEIEKIFNFNLFMNSDFNTFDFNAFNFNENKDEIFINTSKLEDDSNAIESGSKTGSTSSGVKRRASQESELSSKHYRSVSLDSCFNNLVKKPPLPPMNLMSKVSSTNSLHGNDIVGSNSKHARRMMANREAARRSKEKKDQRIVYLEHKEMLLKKNIKIFSRQLPFFEENKAAVMTENEELKIQIESMKQHLKLGDAMNKQLNAEIKWLKEAIVLNQQLSTQVQQLNIATALNEQVSAEVQQLNLTTGEVMQNPNDFEKSNIQPMNENMLQQVNFNKYNQSYPRFEHSNQQM